MKGTYITNRQFDIRLKTIETKNIKKYGSSLTATSLSNGYFRDCIICIHDDNLLEIDEDKYKEIRKRVTSEDFNLK